MQRKMAPVGLMALVLFLTGMTSPVWAKGDAMTKGVKNIVLVHGAWTDASSWQKIIPLLEAKGLHVTAVQNPLTTLRDDVASTARAIALQDGPTMLVGHSYGGMVITEAGNDPKIAGLVYLAAFAPSRGESLGSIVSQYPAAPSSSEIKPYAEGYLYMSPKGISEYLAQDLSAAEKSLLIATQKPIGTAVISDAVSSAAWEGKPSWYVLAENDHAMNLDLQRATAEKINAKSIALESSHQVITSHPKEVADLIERAAASIEIPSGKH